MAHSEPCFDFELIFFLVLISSLSILNIFGYHDHTWLLMIILVLVTIAWRVVAVSVRR